MDELLALLMPAAVRLSGLPGLSAPAKLAAMPLRT